jgi:glycosyltransferase involved in cell wall biosynthesis
MPKFNPLDHPICFASPLRLGETPWSAHIPFGMTLVDLLRPRVIVELGTNDGVSYGAFCQAVRALTLDARCYAVGNLGDGERGVNDESLLGSLEEHHDALYGRFSRLLQDPSEISTLFENGAIDLLHLSHNSSYDSTKCEFETWLPKMSNRGVVLLTGTNSHEDGCEVWKLWEEIKFAYPHFELGHERGLGVISVGKDIPDGLRKLLEAPEPDLSLVREFFRQLGYRMTNVGNGHKREESRGETKDHQERLSILLPAALETRTKELEQERRGFHALARELEVTQKALLASDERLSVVMDELDTRSLELGNTAAQLNAIINSRAWRWVTRYGRVKDFSIHTASRTLSPLLGDDHRKQKAAENYAKWIRDYDTLTDFDREAILRRIQRLGKRPLISVVMPVYNSPDKWLRRAIESVRRQLYPHWELCIADDCSSRAQVRRILEDYARKDSRIKVTFRKERGHISHASNSALDLASGQFIGFLDHDDELSEHALYMVAEELNGHPEADLIYTDEDKINKRGKRYDPHFKTEWNDDLFYSMNCISHFGVYRTSILRAIGGFRPGYEGSQDYDLTLRVIERTTADRISHIPYILYHWRAVPGSTARGHNEKLYAHNAARAALRSHFERLGKTATIEAGYRNYHRVVNPLPASPPLVSLIVGTRDRLDLLRQVTSGILEETDYAPIELLIIDNQSTDPATLAYLDEIQRDARVRVIRYEAPFSFSAINNLGVSKARGEIIGLINNDIKVISPDWLREMVSHAVRPEIGAVGAKLYYANDTIQHAGVIVGLGGVAGHAQKHFSRTDPGYNCRLHVIQNFSAVTAACLVMRRQLFSDLGGLNEVNLPIAFNDVDLCLRLRERGYRILWTPYAELYHLESASRGSDEVPHRRIKFRKEANYMKTTWDEQLANDPYYSPNLTLDREDFSLAFPPRVTKPWRREVGGSFVSNPGE